MSTVRGSLGCATLGGKVYAIGGGVPDMYYDNAEVYDPAVNSWAPGEGQFASVSDARGGLERNGA